MLTLEMIQEAREALRGVARRTPLDPAPMLGKNVYIKAENLQLTGAFKLRGAYNKIRSLTPEEAAQGVIACSAGNHAQGIAISAAKLGLSLIHIFEKRHLVLRDTAMQDHIQGLLDRRDAQRTARRQAQQEEQERRAALQRLKLTRNSQAAFNIPQAQMEDLIQTWTVSSGTYLSGPSKGEPRVPDRMKPNSLCLLTQRPQGGAEGDRRIIGGFMVREDFFGNACLDGMIQAHPEHRILLSRECQPLFWQMCIRDRAIAPENRAAHGRSCGILPGGIIPTPWRNTNGPPRTV